MPHPHPLWKQFLGAAAGSAIALALYGGYTAVQGMLPARLVTETDIAASSASRSSSAVGLTDLSPKGREIARYAKQLAAVMVAQGDSGTGDDLPSVAAATVIVGALSPRASSSASSSSVSSVARIIALRPVHTAQHDTLHTSAPLSPRLPQTGSVLWIGCVLALCAAAGVHRQAIAAHLRRWQRAR